MLVVHPTIYDGFHTSQVHRYNRIHSRITHRIPFSKLFWILLICQFVSQKNTQQRMCFVSVFIGLGIPTTRCRAAFPRFLVDTVNCWTGAASIPVHPWETLRRHRHQTSSVQALLPMIEGRHGQAVVRYLDYTRRFRTFSLFFANYCLSLKPKSFLKPQIIRLCRIMFSITPIGTWRKLPFILQSFCVIFHRAPCHLPLACLRAGASEMDNLQVTVILQHTPVSLTARLPLKNGGTGRQSFPKWGFQ